MVFLLGKTLPPSQHVLYALAAQFEGVGRTTASRLCSLASIHRFCRVRDLNERHMSRLREALLPHLEKVQKEKIEKAKAERLRPVPVPMPALANQKRAHMAQGLSTRVMTMTQEQPNRLPILIAVTVSSLIVVGSIIGGVVYALKSNSTSPTNQPPSTQISNAGTEAFTNTYDFAVSSKKPELEPLPEQDKSVKSIAQGPLGEQPKSVKSTRSIKSQGHAPEQPLGSRQATTSPKQVGFFFGTPTRKAVTITLIVLIILVVLASIGWGVWYYIEEQQRLLNAAELEAQAASDEASLNQPSMDTGTVIFSIVFLSISVGISVLTVITYILRI